MLCLLGFSPPSSSSLSRLPVPRSAAASQNAEEVGADQRLEVLFDELAELAGQRNAIDARIVEIVAEVDRDELWGATGARSVAALVAWKTGSSPGNAHTIATVAGRLGDFQLRKAAGRPTVIGSAGDRSASGPGIR